MARLERLLCNELAALLRSAGGCAEHPAPVEVKETHISWLMLTGRFVYKLKKPVHLEFLDFRTLDDRRRACEAEVELNRRLAPHVYLDAVPITRDASGSIELGGSGPVVDWVVKMRRLPADRSLAHLIREDTVTERDVANVARVAADFYLSQPPLCVRPDDYRKRLADQVADNIRVLAKRLPVPSGDSRPRSSSARCDAELESDLRQVHAAQCRFLALFSDVLHRRVCDGRIVDGHGDLHPEHIYVESPPAVIDCIEFNDPLRHLDVADELAFLAMECDRLGAGWVGRQIAEACCQAARDDVPPVLMAFYKGYRAVARAKVASLCGPGRSERQRAEADALARDYLRLARRYLGPLGTPILLVVAGLMGTGKSTLASGLGQWLAIDHLQTDEVRRELFGASDAPAAYEAGIYRSDLRHQVYEGLFERTEALLSAGRSAVLDGTFLLRRWWEGAIEVARRQGALPLVVACRCPRRVALARLAQRANDGRASPDARADLYDRQADQRQPLDKRLPVVRVDTTLALNDQLERVAKRLRTEITAAGILAAPAGRDAS